MDFSDLIIFSISLGVVCFSFMFEKESLKFVCKQCMGLLQFNEVLSFVMLLVFCQLLLKRSYLKSLQLIVD